MLRPFIHTLMTGSQQGPQPEVWTNILLPEYWDTGPGSWIGSQVQSEVEGLQGVQLIYKGPSDLNIYKYRIVFASGYGETNFCEFSDRSYNTLSYSEDIDNTGLQEIMMYNNYAPIDTCSIGKYMSGTSFVIDKIEAVLDQPDPRMNYEGWISVVDPIYWYSTGQGSWDGNKWVSGIGESFVFYDGKGFFNGLVPTKVKVSYSSSLISSSFVLVVRDYYDEIIVAEGVNYLSEQEVDVFMNNSQLFSFFLGESSMPESEGQTEITDIQLYFPSGTWTNLLDSDHFQFSDGMGYWESAGVAHSATVAPGVKAVVMKAIGTWTSGFTPKKVRAILGGLEEVGANEEPIFRIRDGSGNKISKATVPYFSYQALSCEFSVGDIDNITIAANMEFTVIGLEFFN